MSGLLRLLGCDKREQLCQAVQSGDAAQVDQLCGRIGNVNFRQPLSNLTPLHIAATLGHVHVMEVLRGHDAQVNSTDDRNRSPLYCAALAGQKEATMWLLDHFASIDATTLDGLTPLFAACWRGHLEIVQELISAGASIQHRDADGRSCADIAREWNHTRVAEFMQRVIAERANSSAPAANGSASTALAQSVVIDMPQSAE